MLQIWTRPLVAFSLFFVFCVVYFGSIGDANFRSIVAKPDNVPITIMVVTLLALGYTATLGFSYESLAREKQTATGIADQIMEQAHNRGWDVFDRSIDLRVMRLRRKIERNPDKPEIIKTVRLTEKGTTLSERFNQYTVVADRRANKIQIRHAVQELFKVKVIDVSTMNVRGKYRRQRTTNAGKAPDWKKAIVTLKQGDKIVLT